jgi:hypothetical protein
MKKLCTLFFLFVTQIAFSQPWQLYQPHQLTHYQNTVDTTQIISINMDSVIINGNNSTGLFNQHDFYNALAPCSSVTFWNQPYYTSGKFYDTLTWNADTSRMNQFYFLTNAVLNQSWIITSPGSGSSTDTVTITCTGIQPETFLGITDSVKTFSLASTFSNASALPLNNFQFKLSKNYGLIEYLPFQCIYAPQYYYPKSYRIIGINNNATIGFAQPSFTDYFHLSTGDVILWKRDYDSFNFIYPDFTEYYTDSITNSVLTPDSVVYTLNRATLNKFGNVVFNSGIIQKFLKEDYEPLFSSNGNSMVSAKGYEGGWGGFSQKELWGINAWHHDTAFFPATNLIKCDFSLSYFKDTTDCSVREYIDISSYFSVNTLLGLSQHILFNFDTDNNYVIGATINGVTYNRAPVLPVAIVNQTKNNTISVYPNPATNVITISSNKNVDNYTAIICDVTGKKVHQTKLTKNTIDIKNLLNGFYLLKLTHAKNEELNFKFVKE